MFKLSQIVADAVSLTVGSTVNPNYAYEVIGKDGIKNVTIRLISGDFLFDEVAVDADVNLVVQVAAEDAGTVSLIIDSSCRVDLKNNKGTVNFDTLEGKTYNSCVSDGVMHFSIINAVAKTPAVPAKVRKATPDGYSLRDYS